LGEKGEEAKGGKGEERNDESLFPSSPLRPFAPSSFASWVGRALVGCLFLLALSAPHSIAVSQGAWMLAAVLWVLRLLVRPRPPVWRTPVDVALLGFFTLTFLTALTSYDPEVSIGKLRAASLFTAVYVVAENVASRRVLRGLALALVASCALNVVFTFGAFAAGRGVKARGLRRGLA
jgi:O-antigen ligase